MPIYTCDKCSKDFSNKTDFVRHKNNKLPCDGKNLKNIQEIIEQKVEEVVAKRLEEKLENKNVGVIMNLVKNLSNILRGKVSATGQKAYYDIIRLLLLKFMEPYITPSGKLAGLLNPANYSAINGFIPDHMKYLSFSNLVKTLDMDFEEKIYLVWSMLSLYPFTNPVFPKNKAFNCHPTVLELACRHIYKAMENINFDEINEDIGGAIYEHFVNEKDGGGGKSLGQYFTPRRMINLINKLNLEIFPDNKPKTIYDPCAGTGGFIMEMIKTAKVAPDNIYGGEIEPDTFASCLMNMMLTTGTMTNIRNVDSFKNNSTQLYDWIGTNPPFGMKGLDYQSILDNPEFKPAPVKKGTQNVRSCIPTSEMYPIKTSDGSALFLQHCISKLALKGMCNIVLPAGQLLTGKNAYAKIRQHLIQECMLKAVLAVPSGTFEHAGVSTVVLFFTKLAKSCTGEVDFYETDKTCESFKKLGTVEYEELVDKNYVLDWKYYKKTEVFKPIDSTWEMKTLGEVCEFVRGKSLTKANIKEGDYPVIGGGQNPMGYHNEYNTEENAILCSSSGAYAGFVSRYSSKVWKSDCFEIKSKSEKVSNEYIYRFLKSRQLDIYKMQEGAAQPHIYGETISDIQIPIPSLEKQQEIITRCEEYDLDIQSNSALIGSLEASKAIITKAYVKLLFKSVDVKTLGEVCEIQTGEYITKANKKEGDYPIYGGGDQSGTHETYNCENAIVVAKDGMSKECVRYVKGRFFLNHHAWNVKSTTETLLIDYLKHYLISHQHIIYALASGAAQKGINMEQFNSIQIPIPSLEKQQEIISKYETIDECISTARTTINAIETQKNEYLVDLFNNTSSN